MERQSNHHDESRGAKKAPIAIAMTHSGLGGLLVRPRSEAVSILHRG